MAERERIRCHGPTDGLHFATLSAILWTSHRQSAYSDLASDFRASRRALVQMQMLYVKSIVSQRSVDILLEEKGLRDSPPVNSFFLPENPVCSNIAAQTFGGQQFYALFC